MDGAAAAYAAWSEEADRLRAGGPLAALAPVLDAVRAGIRLRRRLDEQGYEGTPTTAPELLRRQIELEHLAHDRMTERALSESERAALSARVEAALREDQAYLGGLLTRPDLDEPLRAVLLERFRHDLRWAGLLVAGLEGTRLPLPTAMAEADLGRLHRTLRALEQEDNHDDERLRQLTGRWGRLSLEFLGRQVEAEVAAPVAAEAPASELWSRRVRLSRLQARVEAMAAEVADDRAEALRAGSDQLAARRAALAAAAEARLDALEPDLRRLAWEGLALAMKGEANDIVTDLEELPLPEAVRLLGLARGDLDLLARSGRRSLRERRHRADPDGRGTRAAVGRVGRLERLAHNEWQEKRLALRLERLLGRRFVTWMENTVLVLILLVTGLITAEMVLEATRGLTPWQHAAFAWADLAICTVFLAEFGLKLALTPERLRYFRRHFLVDFLASIPFGFLAYVLTTHHVAIARGIEGVQFLRLLRFGRLTRLVRYVRLARPLIRLGRILIFALRFTDRLVRRYASLLNQNIVLFERDDHDAAESRPGHLLAGLRRLYNQRVGVVQAALGVDDRLGLAAAVLADLEALPEPGATATATAAPVGAAEVRAIPVEAVVEHLIELTPEQLLEERGPTFVESVDRYIRLFDAPLVRRLPGIRELVSYRQSGPAEGVALAANALGSFLQGVLNVVYYVADLQATISPPLFLDRLGATIVGATQRPAKRLLSLGASFLVLFLLVYNIEMLRSGRGFVDRLQALLGWPVIILGTICLVFWVLGAWLRRIANQAADFCDRVAEAQFASQTRHLKVRSREADLRFLHQRVIDPELALRAADDRTPAGTPGSSQGEPRQPDDDVPDLADGELLFLGNVQLLYEDYLEGSPLHRNDTKATNQLLGNLALVNLRRSHLGYMLAAERRLDRLDLSRSGAGVLGGPYLWFNYITRMIVQETAKLLVDYNRHAIPLDRLACSPERLRGDYRRWLSGRLGVEPSAVELPPRVGGFDLDESDAATTRHRQAVESFENVEFTAIDFLAHDPQRDRLIHRRYGAQVLNLLHQDRRRIVRRAFRSYPLHTLPRAQRTVNLYAVYRNYLAGGRVLALPLVLFWQALKLAVRLAGGLVQVIGEILHPRVSEPQDAERPESFAVALRKIHRMRKPAFMESLRLRAAFDVEYLGLPLPSAPASLSADSLMERDLDFIGANRRDRLAADRVRRDQADRLTRLAGWLERFGWTFPELIPTLERDFPFLADRAGEALRALVTACIIDYDDIATLGTSIDALRAVMDAAAGPGNDPRRLPPGLPPPLTDLRRLWRPTHRGSRPISALFDLPCFPAYDSEQRRRILRVLRRHRRVVGGWVDVVLGQGGDDPWETVRDRLRLVLLRTDLWSDQILVLRAIQTLTLLDVHHYSELVRELGGYEVEPEPDPASPDGAPAPPGDPVPASTALRSDER